MNVINFKYVLIKNLKNFTLKRKNLILKKVLYTILDFSVKIKILINTHA